MVHMHNKSFKKYKNFFLKDRILSLTVHTKLQYNWSQELTSNRAA